MRERMVNGLLYRVNEELKAEQMRTRELLRLYNNTGEEETERRQRLIAELLGSRGDNVVIEPTFRCDYGSNISVGNNFYANFDCVVLDVCPVVIGNNVLLGPRVGLYAAAHPTDAGVRATMLEWGQPITIGDDVWIGGHAVVNGGVRIGNGSIIGSGSVVTKSIPSGVIAAGNPCRVIRAVTQEDADYWQKKKAEFDAAMGARGGPAT